MRTKFLWASWLVVVLGASGYLGAQLFRAEEKPFFLVGETTPGHYQIEMQCTVCHQSPFGGKEILQEACTGCHAPELEIAQDSHPRSKFTDPRNADRLAQLDARYCVTCHQEHVEERTNMMAVTLPEDLCFHCHQDIEEDRPSHLEFGFETCASSGCHNYHDNRALYEDFLTANADGNWLLEEPGVPDTELGRLMALLGHDPQQPVSNRIPEHLPDVARYQADWSRSAHGGNGVSCNSCHGATSDWVRKPALASCADCHDVQVEAFQAGRHGMRLAQNLAPMTPGGSRQSGNLAFHPDSLDRQLDCGSCHDVHSTDTRTAAVEACLGCHQDTHSLAFLDSPHGDTWTRYLAGQRAEQDSVSCATCHLPRMEQDIFGQPHVLVQHNQNDTLRPNEKMIRPVCMNCHNLAFSIDALADPALIENNFTGQPARHIESIDMSINRLHRPR